MAGLSARDPWLCEPASRRGCLCRWLRGARAHAVQRGQALLAGAGLRPRGFVAPAYAYTRALRRALRSRFAWYGGLLAIHAPRPLRTPAHGLGTSTDLKRRTSPPLLRLGARLPTAVLRIDVHPADFDQPTHIAALDAALAGVQRRRPVTYDQLIAQ